VPDVALTNKLDTKDKGSLSHKELLNAFKFYKRIITKTLKDALAL